MMLLVVIFCLVVAPVANAVEKHEGVNVMDAGFIHSDGAHVRFIRATGNKVDAEMSGTPLYLQNKVIHSPGFEKDDESCMFDKNRKTEYFTRIAREPNETLAFGSGWHSDLTFYKETPYLSTVMGIDLYNNKTNTLFKDMRHVLRDWDENVGIPLNGLYANHTDDFNYWALHPVVRSDVPGSPALFVNRAFTRNIIGDDTGLLEKLLTFIDEHKGSEFEVEWRMGQMLIWDNTYLQHSTPPVNHASNPLDQRREIRRVIVTGWVPI